MAKPLIKKHLQAIKLRKQGQSYSQIKKQLGVSKSSLSLWLKKLPLSKERIRELRDFNEQRIEKFRNTMRAKKISRLQGVYKAQCDNLLPLTPKELYIAGLFLYWGEGLKASPAMVSVSNSDPKVIKFAIYWFTHVLHVPIEKLRIRIHLYRDMDIYAEIRFWSQALHISQKQFIKPYIKKTTLKSLVHKGFGHGTCDVTFGDVTLREKIMMGIQSVSDYYTDDKIDKEGPVAQR